MERLFFSLCGVNGFLAVALGAFGAHGLTKHLADTPDAAQRLAWWQTAAQYHLVHALAIAVAAVLVSKLPGENAPVVAGFAFTVGILAFSGSLYTMTLTGVRWLGAITPIGGVAMLVGWAAVVLASSRL